MRIGLAGIGFMGVTHFRAWQQIAGAQVAAICTRSPKKLAGQWQGIAGNFGPAGAAVDLSGVACHETLERMLADDSLDLIDICLPTALHEEATLAALARGKHVLVEKPIARDSQAGRRMVAAAQRAGRLLLVAHVLHFWPPWRFLREVVAGGELGALRTLNLRRIIGGPAVWQPEHFVRNGGPVLDLHIHDVDYLLWLLGKPVRVQAQGLEQSGGFISVASVYRFASGVVASCQCGAVSVRARPFFQEFEACLEKGVVCFAGASEPASIDAGARQSAQQALTIYHADGTVAFPQCAETDAFVAQLRHVAQCVESGQPSDEIDGQHGLAALELVELEMAQMRQHADESRASAGRQA